ncbi:uncharacterized protein FIESC28_05862 [Fusarium coffeatum]|uniref:Ubiquitin 3 binding protein But2 C-terminal domain-containing protein n=1 Tax=Fusarium coffeatum TaxID=231269 RepID=A0A366RPS4_9HYPO|nr:uncharacterized protein FIESC28_05862 [Fusarium coffeatum]RBR18812.1 hypothetical protein FIESC28_05862 [Fusarium coffeatum]
MRFALFCSIALGADIVVASVCKPRHSTDSSGVSGEASSTVSEISSATGTELETATTSAVSSYVTIETTASVDLSTSAVTLTSEDETTAETMSSELSSTYTEDSITTVSEATTIIAETTTTAFDESTTTLAETTTTAAAPPIQTFQVTAQGVGPLLGFPSPGSVIAFNLQNNPPLSLTLDPESSHVRVGGLYWCVSYQMNPAHPASLSLCSEDQRDSAGFLTCDESLQCSAPAGLCGFNVENMEEGCWTTPGVFSKFYVLDTGNSFRLFLVSVDNSLSGSQWSTVELQAAPAALGD